MSRDIKDTRDIEVVESLCVEEPIMIDINNLSKEQLRDIISCNGLSEEPKEVYKGSSKIPNYKDYGVEENFDYTLYLPIHAREEDVICHFMFEYKKDNLVHSIPYLIAYGFNPMCFLEDRFTLKEEFIEFLQYEAPYLLENILKGENIG